MKKKLFIQVIIITPIYIKYVLYLKVLLKLSEKESHPALSQGKSLMNTMLDWGNPLLNFWPGFCYPDFLGQETSKSPGPCDSEKVKSISDTGAAFEHPLFACSLLAAHSSEIQAKRG